MRSSDSMEEEDIPLMGEKLPLSPSSPAWQQPPSRRKGQKAAIGLLSAALCVSLAGNLLSRLRPARYERQGADFCPTDAFEAGSWQKKAHAVNVTSAETWREATGYSGFSGEGYFWGLPSGGWEAYTEPLSYEWQPSPACRLQRPTIVQKLQSLVEDGGLMLVGDSLSYQHFFALSGELYPHVRWDSVSILPVADAVKGRAQLQHLYLNAESDLVAQLRLPAGFDINARPVVTWHGAMIGVSTDELRAEPGANLDIIPERYEAPATDASYRELNSSWTIDRFVDPQNNYRTMIVSWGAHISANGAFPAANFVQLQQLLRSIFRIYFRNLKTKLSPSQRVLVRAAPPGHNHGAERATMQAEMPATGDPHNWRDMPMMNVVAREETHNLQDSRFHWMDGERIARTRPDAHMANDGLHYQLGAGVFETWSLYMWHLIWVL